MGMRLQSILFEDIEQHLRSRGLDPDKTKVILDKQSGLATFLLYNLSGQLVGYQKYNPKGDKNPRNDPVLGKYFTWVTKESDKVSKIAVWGLESLSPNSRILFVTEGIFDCIKIHNVGFPAIAVLSNNPQPLKAWFKALGHIKTVAICQNDTAGQKLRNVTDKFVSVPDEYNDLGDMPQEQVNIFIKSIIKHI